MEASGYHIFIKQREKTRGADEDIVLGTSPYMYAICVSWPHLAFLVVVIIPTFHHPCSCLFLLK